MSSSMRAAVRERCSSVPTMCASEPMYSRELPQARARFLRTLPALPMIRPRRPLPSSLSTSQPSSAVPPGLDLEEPPPGTLVSTRLRTRSSSSKRLRAWPMIISFSSSSAGSPFRLTLLLTTSSSLSSKPHCTLMMASLTSRTFALCHSAPYFASTSMPGSGSNAGLSASSLLFALDFAVSLAKAAMRSLLLHSSSIRAPLLPPIKGFEAAAGTSSTVSR
mmetsp:Transcript_6745/g.14683  ORF Transcript_6745/g.14683 Transcript_6745/m.14683 type:complete len:220 (-) Transcript_6745:118-777(-)